MKEKDSKLQQTKANKILAKISDFFIKNRKLLLIVGIAIIVGLIVLSVCLIVADSNENKLQVSVDALQTREEELFQKTDYSDEDYASLISDLQTAESKGGKAYSGVKASYILGLSYLAAEDNDNAYDSFMRVYEKNPKSYLAPLALFNAAVVKDNVGDQDAALALYDKITAEYGFDAGVAPKALFNSARIHLAKGDTELAKSTFQQIVDEYSGSSSSSEYVALSKNALLTL
ncbi:MAG: tetratricopeptide repeat protein, partial [Sphaerochaetaceae bacterium]|nr:tetratricopeptide repeat protein [Sphaerochaetaceae bacterium]MDD4006726.1 tetratricopeptide repeat protein [Sphaerochaetaceae bacterium]MDD4396787.1 tetratricopeptide repeat protein [Sphaerochaetaceae bacterium]